MCRYLQVLVVLFMMGDAVNATAEPDYGTEVARLRELSQTKSLSNDNLLEVKSILARLRTQAPKGAHDLSDSLLAIVQSQKDGIVGPLIVPVLCEKADAVAANKLVELISQLVTDLRTHPLSSEDRRTMGASAIVNAFFEDGAEPIASVVGNPRVLLNAVIDSTTFFPPLLRSDVRQKALLVIAKSPLDRSLRKEYAFRYISSRPQEPAPDGFAELFSSDDFQKLRELVRSSLRSLDSFCFGAAGMLAHHGDEVILPDLKRFLQEYATGKPTPEGMVIDYIWQIEIQKSQAKLLEYIATVPQHDGERRMWAIRRAVELDVPKAKVRQSILKHASLVQPSGKFRIREGLSSLKGLGLALNVLDPQDLPEVAVAQGGPTP